MTIAPDLRAMVAMSAALTGLPTAVTLAGGTVVQALPGVASVQDSVLGTGAEISGTERTLRFAAEDVPGLKAGDTLTWNGKTWKVKFPQQLAGGALIKAFLQEVL
jgi:hypothetical protein